VQHKQAIYCKLVKDRDFTRLSILFYNWNCCKIVEDSLSVNINISEIFFLLCIFYCYFDFFIQIHKRRENAYAILIVNRLLTFCIIKKKMIKKTMFSKEIQFKFKNKIPKIYLVPIKFHENP